MSGAQHRRKGALAGRAVERLRGERADPLSLGEAQRGGKGSIGRVGARRGAVVIADPEGCERLSDPPLAIAAPLQGGGTRSGESLVIDIAQLGKARHDRINGRRPVAFPTALMDLAAEIGGELGARRSIAPRIEKREPLQSGTIE